MLSKTGWREAMTEGGVDYKDTKLKQSKKRTRLAHQFAEYPLQSRSSDDEAASPEDEAAGEVHKSPRKKAKLLS